MPQTVASILVGALEQVGVKHIFGLIGDSLNPLADAVCRSDIAWIDVRHEEGAALAAAGQAKLTGRLAVCAGTTDRSRQVIALTGDGGFNMLMSEFLTAVHHKLPVKVVVYNNSSFGLHDEINAALTVDGPAVVDCVVAADETPNLPHIDLETVGNVAVARIREALLAVTGP